MNQAQNTIAIVVTATCTYRSGTSAKGNPYVMAEAYAEIPGVDFPQKFDYYCTKVEEVLKPGQYLCDIKAEVKDGRVSLTIDPRESRRVAAPTSTQQPQVKAAG